jgi:transposase
MSDVAEEHKVTPQYRRNTSVDLPEIGVMRSAIFTPTSASWLNTIKGFFAKLMRRRLKRGVFCPVVELQAAINRFLAETNPDPRHFRWTKAPDKMLAAVKGRTKC